MKAPARAEADRVLRMARSASECQMSDGMSDGPFGWGATDRARQNMPHLSGSPAFLVTLSSHTMRRDLMKIAGTPHACCAVSPTEFDMGCPSHLARGQSTFLASGLPLDFGMETRGKMLNLIGKTRCSSGSRNFTSYTKDFHTHVCPDHKNRSLHRNLIRRW